MSDRLVAACLALAAAAVYVALGGGLSTDYDYFGRLALALLEGRWWLHEAPSWLNELVACGEGRHCVVYPPLPAILALPLAPVVGPALAQSLVSQICGGLAAGVLYLALRALGARPLVGTAGAVLSALGTTLLFTSVDGRAWFAAHAVAVLFGSVALLLAARGERPWLIGVAIGLAALARLPVAAAFPALAMLAAHRAGRPPAPVLRDVILGGAPFAALYVGYNLLRWGSVADLGYLRLTEGDHYYEHGLFSPLYLPRHLRAIFLEAPELAIGGSPPIRFSIVGTGLLFTTPAFLWVLGGLWHARFDRALRWTALAALLALVPSLVHGTVGFAQFGYRFSLDAQPFLIALAAAGASAAWRHRLPARSFLVATALAVAVNVYATILITRFGHWD